MADKKWKDLTTDEKLESLKLQLETALGRVQTCEDDIQRLQGSLRMLGSLTLRKG